jgi:hypothetical protein
MIAGIYPRHLREICAGEILPLMTENRNPGDRDLIAWDELTPASVSFS